MVSEIPNTCSWPLAATSGHRLSVPASKASSRSGAGLLRTSARWNSSLHPRGSKAILGQCRSWDLLWRWLDIARNRWHMARDLGKSPKALDLGFRCWGFRLNGRSGNSFQVLDLSDRSRSKGMQMENRACDDVDAESRRPRELDGPRLWLGSENERATVPDRHERRSQEGCVLE